MTQFSSWQLICVLVLIYLTHQCFKAIKYNGLRRKWYTKPCRKSGQSSLQRTRAMKEASKKGHLFEYHEQQFIRENAHTLEMRVFTQTIFMTKSAENVKCMLSQNFRDWSLGPRLRAFRPLLGHGIFVSDGARWESSRKLLKPQFSREQISHVRMLEPHVQNLFKQIKAHSGARFDIQPLFHLLTLDAATEFLFGESIGTLNFDKNGSVDEIERKKKFSHAIGFIQEYLIKRANLLDYCWLLNSAEFRRNVKFVHDFTTDFIKKAQIASGTSDASSNYVFLRELLKQTSDPIILRDETLNIMLAGRSTTASLLSSLIYELARNPSVWLKLREVVSINFGKGECGAELDSITFETLAKCMYLRYVMNETLRLHPPVSQNARQATKITTLPVGGGPDGQSPVFIKKR
ncbi:Cytochrome P450 [Metschnikowia aff. pulcherrima]|uniref:Cytochrome P450 n=1 Tax=Metschnikowia aff. pulcherrima TaxID=2163413 RepID=A0A4V1AEN0_9ASCO|nr:Cytochrome P450 [Metschnikowia aff. pulcherrima]